MRIANFILVIDSYLLRLGMVSMLNRIQGVRVLKEFGAADPFLSYLKNHPVNYMILDQPVFESSLELFISKPDLLEKTILLQSSGKETAAADLPQQQIHTTIHPMEDKEAILVKILNLLDQDQQSDLLSPSTNLSPREITIVRLVSMGLTNRQIADKLFLSAHTVMTHRKNINSKLGIKSASGLTVYAIVNNIISLEEVSSLPAK